MTTPGHPLALSREQILTHRRRAGGLGARLPRADDALHHAAWAGLTDSTPRAAVLSLHARVSGTTPSDWEHPALVQVWGPRYSAYAVHGADRAVFTLGRRPADAVRQRFAADLAERLDDVLDGREVRCSEAGTALGMHPNQLRYATTTGRVLIRWDGARQPTIRMAPPPQSTPIEARQELLRRYLHVLGPGTPDGFGEWAGLRARSTRPAFADLGAELTPVRTPVGEGWILSSDESSFRTPLDVPDAVRLLPSGDAYYLLQGRERELLVPDAAHRPLLWTSRVWPGAVVVGNDVVGTWRRADRTVTVSPWHPLPAEVRATVEAEATSFPVPGADAGVHVRFRRQDQADDVAR